MVKKQKLNNACRIGCNSRTMALAKFVDGVMVSLLIFLRNPQDPPNPRPPPRHPPARGICRAYAPAGVYTVRFLGVIYVLHCFQKKSNRGSETPKHDIELVKLRLKTAEAHYRENYSKGFNT